jgi:hypothetical protein
MPSGRRLLVLVAVCAVVAIPAGVLRAMCAAQTCNTSGTVSTRVPFCPLPATVRSLVANGFYEGRSPDVLGVTNVPVAGGGSAGAPWPSADVTQDLRVPLAFLGAGVDARARIDDPVTLDRVAPTLMKILGTDWRFPDVHPGLPLRIATRERPRLILEIVWTGGGTAALEADPHAARAWRRLARDGVGTLAASAGSLPLDPAATLTTIATGALPSHHGITGGLIRNDDGTVVEPWSRAAPTSVIAALGDDLAFGDPGTKIGAVLASSADQGIVGGTWNGSGDVAQVSIERRRPEAAVASMLADGFGADDIPDVIGVVVAGPASSFAQALDTIVRDVRRRVPATTVVLTATGPRAATDAIPDADVAEEVDAAVRASAPIVEAVTPGGLMLDRDVLVSDGLSSTVAVQPMLRMRDPRGRTVFRDAFPGFAVSFARYC